MAGGRVQVEDELGRLWWVWPKDPAGQIVTYLGKSLRWIVLPRQVVLGGEFDGSLSIYDDIDRLRRAYEQTKSTQIGKAFARRVRLLECLRLLMEGGVRDEATLESNTDGLAAVPLVGEAAASGLGEA